MKQKLPSILAFICLFASACGSVTAPSGKPINNQKATPERSENYCTVVSSVESTPNPTDEALNALVPLVNDTDWVEGPASAEITFVEYIDFQCPGCAALAPVLEQLRADFPDDLRIVLRHFPLPIHDKSLLTAQAAEAAGLQGKFWEMKTALFGRQGEWVGLSDTDLEAWLDRTAIAIGVDPKKFNDDLKSQAIVSKVLAAREKATSLGIPYTPFLIINGKMWQGSRDYFSLKDVINLMLLEKRQVTGCPPFTIDITKQYIASIETEKGTIVIQLYADKAPLAVNSFVFLANNGYFDGITFHRVVKGYLAQSGDPSGTGYGGPGYAFVNEINPSLKFDKAGVVGMANIGPDTNGSQFFITLTPMPNLDGNYTIFGQVIQGMDVVQNLTERDSSKGIPLSPGDKILRVTVEVK